MLIGYIIAAFTEKKQALHDIIAGTLVVKKAQRTIYTNRIFPATVSTVAEGVRPTRLLLPVIQAHRLSAWPK